MFIDENKRFISLSMAYNKAGPFYSKALYFFAYKIRQPNRFVFVYDSFLEILFFAGTRRFLNNKFLQTFLTWENTIGY